MVARSHLRSDVITAELCIESSFSTTHAPKSLFSEITLMYKLRYQLAKADQALRCFIPLPTFFFKMRLLSSITMITVLYLYDRECLGQYNNDQVDWQLSVIRRCWLLFVCEFGLFWSGDPIHLSADHYCDTECKIDSKSTDGNVEFIHE